MERTGSGGRQQRCSPVLTSIGGAAARRPRRRGGLAAPRLPPQPRTRTQRQRCGGASGRGAPGHCAEGAAGADAVPRERRRKGRAGSAVGPWQRSTRRGWRRRSHGSNGRREEVGPLLLVDNDGGADQRDPRRILGGCCPRRRSISISSGGRGGGGSGSLVRSQDHDPLTPCRKGRVRIMWSMYCIEPLGRYI